MRRGRVNELVHKLVFVLHDVFYSVHTECNTRSGGVKDIKHYQCFDDFHFKEPLSN